jgi:hypothetical protein
LARPGHIADFIEKRVEPSANSNLPFFCRDRTGKSAFFVAEQLALDQMIRQSSAVNRHHRPAASAALRDVWRGDQFLAGAALAGD